MRTSPGQTWTRPPRRRRWIPLLVLALAVGAVIVAVRDRGSVTSALDGPPGGITVATASGSRTGQPVDTSRFADGSCVVFGPTSGNRHETVFLDAGHGGIDPGAVGRTESGAAVQEADATLPVELDAMADLTAQGYRVAVSRTSASTVTRLTSVDTNGNLLSTQGVVDDLAARDVCANKAGASALVGIYFDAGAPSSMGSLATYDAARPFATQSHQLATLVQTDVLAAMNGQGWEIPADGIVSDAGLGGPAMTASSAAYGHLQLLGPPDPPIFTTPSVMPGTVVEPLYITDPFEGSIAASPSDRAVIGRGVAQAVEQYFAASVATPSAG
ncbi:MAG: N-acetylmuramoyl-L-alanine amidase family protein [Actinomycetota bacterium]